MSRLERILQQFDDERNGDSSLAECRISRNNPVVTPLDVRSVALSFDGAYEDSHMGHPDFRGPRGIFMTMTRDEDAVVVRLPPSLADSVMSERRGAELASRFGGACWIRFKLVEIELAEAVELAEVAWHFRNQPAR